MDEEAREVAHYRGEGGQIIGMDLPLDEHMADKVTKGYLHRVNEDGSPWQDEVVDWDADLDDDEGDETGDSGGSDLTNGVPARPAINAPKAEWVGYCVNALGMTPDDAEAATKQDLIERANQQ